MNMRPTHRPGPWRRIPARPPPLLPCPPPEGRPCRGTEGTGGHDLIPHLGQQQFRRRPFLIFAAFPLFFAWPFFAAFFPLFSPSAVYLFSADQNCSAHFFFAASSANTAPQERGIVNATRHYFGEEIIILFRQLHRLRGNSHNLIYSSDFLHLSQKRCDYF